MNCSVVPIYLSCITVPVCLIFSAFSMCLSWILSWCLNYMVMPVWSSCRFLLFESYLQSCHFAELLFLPNIRFLSDVSCQYVWFAFSCQPFWHVVLFQCIDEMHCLVNVHVSELQCHVNVSELQCHANLSQLQRHAIVSELQWQAIYCLNNVSELHCHANLW